MYRLIILILLPVLISCDGSQRNSSNSKFNPENLKNIDSLGFYLNKTPKARDTIFLGFRLGMSKKQYKRHISDLRNEGKKIMYEKGLGVKYGSLNVRVDLGDRYVYYTPISMKKYNDEVMTGNARCILIPAYNNKNQLVSLKIVSWEDWDDSYYEYDKWIEKSVRNKYRKFYFNRRDINSALSKVFEEIFERTIKDVYPGSETMMIVDHSMVYDVEYRSTKNMIAEAMLELKTKEIKKEKAAETTF